MNSFSAHIQFSFDKGCIIQVPDKWISDYNEKINIFKIYYEEDNEAYVSCLPSKKLNCSNPSISINAKFADKLRLKEKDMVLLQPFNSHIDNVQVLVLEPLTSDDWEILELNAATVERELINQIRVVWKNLVFPVWINNTCIFVKVANTKPNSQPLLLVEFSELHIVAKDRQSSEFLSPELEKSSQKSSPYSQFLHLRSRKSYTPTSSKFETNKENEIYEESDSDLEPKSTAARAFSLFSAFFSTSREEKIDESNDEFLPLNIEGILRVIPYKRSGVSSLPTAVQATTVFITATTYIGLYGNDEEIPPCFAAVLQKYPSPESRKAKVSTSKQKQSKDLKDDASKDSSNISLDKKKSKTNSSVSDEKHLPFNSVCVTVMVVRSSEEDEFNLPPSLFYSKNFIVVPKELKKCLNLEVASLVYLKGVMTKPVELNKILLHSTSTLNRFIEPTQANEEVLTANFNEWAFPTDEPNTTYVISDGTLITFRVYGQRLEFFVSLSENSDQSINSSSSSFSAVSPGSSTSEQKLNQKYPSYGYLSQNNINKITILIGSQMCNSIFVDRPYLRLPENLYLDLKVPTLESLGGIKKYANEALENLEFWLKLRPISYISNHSYTCCGSILICGPKGVGKSSLANALCKKLASQHNVFVKVISCLPLKGKRLDTISKSWEECLIESAYCQPSVILFEDLDFIASCPASQEQEAGPDGLYFSNIVQIFVHLINKARYFDGKLAIIATAQSPHSLHPHLMNTKGRHIFQSIIDIQPPDVEERKEILCSLVSRKEHISNKTIEAVSWSKVAAKTEGYVAQDLDSLVDRATHAAWVRMAEVTRAHEITLHVEDFEMALEGYIPSSLQGIPLQVHDHKSWNDVGGLSDVKKVVQQIIMWPLKYKSIFKNYKLKPQTNILLYGAPGTGKTLLAGVIANECGLNFISIKGPELLSKYIGASEQAVRDLFKRATTARPCILFFDEFDSIAPRRGHDSTGVTDRVVNQLLTQLDGVESLEGVHVLAASSRPELIDPALLRPGRLDKCILCPLPNKEERIEILKCLSLKLPLNEDVEFDPIAETTEHFSGADLQALLYTANIEALHDAQSSSTRRYSTSSKDISYTVASNKLLYMPSIEDGLKTPSYEDGQKIIQDVSVIKENFCGFLERRRSRQRSTLCVSISQNNLLRVADDMKPSVSAKERERYEKVFKNFQSGTSGESVSSVVESIKRVTLA